MEQIYKDLINNVIIKESSKYTDDPTDRGGKTKYGITEAVARENKYTGNMKDITYDFAYNIYYNKYVFKLSIDKILKISNHKIMIKLAEEILDTGVNMGVGTSGKFVQEALNLLNNQEKIYNDITPDGNIGINTLKALEKYFEARGLDGIQVLINLLNGYQIAKYIAICKNDPTQEKYFYGWLKNRVSII